MPPKGKAPQLRKGQPLTYHRMVHSVLTLFAEPVARNCDRNVEILLAHRA